ncbi:hypothetical protein COPG_00038 [Colwellia phage 9A]|uniref:Uncharacterized protein n=1 Tax=Colwellia phage 9A TaxID=765765 RepID=I3UMB9_9CAUD|nr:hypothetical protein COPG_00038 [Colwellia phage 9A]AFK66634.1 hypothetical protein COPG_00038 [Colwellia phage 9A]
MAFLFLLQGKQMKNNDLATNFADDMQISLNSLEGKNISVRYGTFKQFEALLIEHLDDGLQLEVKLSNCGCANLDCHVCKAKWQLDTWIPFEPTNMFYCPKTTEGQGVVYIYDIREAIPEDQKENAVAILKDLGYTIKQGCSWQMPKGLNLFQDKTKANIAKHLVKELFADGDDEPHADYMTAFVEDIFQMIKTGKSASELRQIAKDTISE